MDGVAAGGAEPPARTMTLGPAVETPWGFLSLCGRSPVDCVNEDTPQARAGVVLAARAIARARWQEAIDRAAHTERGLPVRDAGETPALAEHAAPSAEADPSRVELKTVWRRLKRVNGHVNRAIRPASDVEVYGVRDWWVAPLSAGLAPLGDCKDYALEKRRELIKAGVPARTLSIALVSTPLGEPHAVLVVAARDGDYVLDNLARKIRLWSRTPYSWQARQSAADPLVWLSILGEHGG